MRRLAKVLGIVVVLFVAVIVAGVAILKSQDFNAYRTDIAAAVKDATGRDMTIAGDLNLEISLTPTLSVEGVTFANADWGSRSEMVKLDRLAAVVEIIPLLSGDIRIQRVELVGVDVVLETDQTGKGNWEFGAVEPAESAESDSGGPSRLPVVNAISLQNIVVAYRDGVTGEEFKLALDSLDLAGQGLDSPLDIKGAFEFNGEKITLDGRLGPITAMLDNKAYPVKLDIGALGADIGLDGTINRPRDAKGYNIGFTVKGDSLSDVAARGAALAAAEAPALADNGFDISGSLRDEDTRVAIDGLALKIGGTDLGGNISLVPTAPRIGLIADLRSDVFSLSDILVQEEGEAQPASSSGPQDGRVFPDDPLPFDAIKQYDASVDLAVGRFTAQGVSLDDVIVALRLANGKLAIDPLGLVYDGHAVAGAVGIDASVANPAVVVQLNGANIDYGRIVEQATGDATLKGAMDLDVDVNGAGNSVRAIMASLNGDLRIATQDGRIESGALSFLSGDVTDAVPIFQGTGAGERNLECGVIDFNVKQGIATPRALLIETGGVNIIGTGGVNLRDETMDLLFDPRAKTKSLLQAAEIGVRVGGTFLDPTFRPDAASVAKNVMNTATGLAEGLGGLVSGQSSGSSEPDNTDYCAAALAGTMPDPAAKPAASSSEPANDGSSNTVVTPEVPEKMDGTALKDTPVGDALEGVGGALDSLFGN